MLLYYVIFIFVSHHQPRRICWNKSFSCNILCAINAGTVHMLYTWLWIVLIRTKRWYPHYSGICHWHRGRYIITAVLVYNLSGIWMHLSTAFRNYDNVTITKPAKQDSLQYVLKMLYSILCQYRAPPTSVQCSTNAWWRHQMETFSALLVICAGNSPVPGEFPTQRPVTRSFDVYFDLHPNKRLSKQSWGWWFETLSPPLWRHRNGNRVHYKLQSITL